MIKPFAHSVTVADPPDDPPLQTGLIVVGNTGVEYERGVVIDVAPGCPSLEQLTRGNLVFYMKGTAAGIDGVKVVSEQHLIAFDDEVGV